MTTPPTPDPIGAASARLFAGGVGGRERLLALRFLGILLARADDDGLLHADPDDLVGLGLLNGMEWDDIESSRRLLEDVGVLEREPVGWFIRDFAPVGDEVPPADAMAAIARVLNKPVDAPVVVVSSGADTESETESAGTAEPDPVPLPLPLPAVVTPVPEPAHSRFSPRWVAAPAGIAAAILVLALALSGQMNLPGRTVGNNRENAQQVNSARSASPSSEPESNGASSSSPAGSVGGTAAAPLGSAPGTAAPASGTTRSTVSCPLGAVLVAVEKVEQHVDGSVPTAAPPPTQPPSRVDISLPQLVRTTAAGVLRNTSSVPAVVTPFPVEVTFTNSSGAVTTTVTAIALTNPVTVQPGQALQWSVVVDNPDSAPFPAGAKAGTLSWRWEDGILAAACPH
jgi:hypothetical protein